MNRKMMGKVALVSLMLGVSTIACTPGQQSSHVASISDQAFKGKQIAARAADQARAAMARHKAAVAVDAAEKAVANAPMDASYRVLLGQAYLGAGRFASAEAAFRDALTITPNQPKVEFRLALAQIAEGRGQDAHALLKALDGQVPVADLGLALAMAGDRAGGIAMLTDLVRNGQSDARGRQNLALAFALDGRWKESRSLAMMDTAPDRLDDRLASWAALAQPQAGGLAQVAAMLGVKPVSDPGLPTALALAAPSPAAAPVALAAAQPFVPTPLAATLAVSSVAVSAPSIAAAPVQMASAVSTSDLATSVTVPLDAPAAVKATPADAPAAAVVLAAQQATQPAPTAAVATPVLLRAAAVSEPAPLLRAPKNPIRTAALLIAKPATPLLAAKPEASLRKAGFVVQLGAFKRAGAIQAAWSRASKLMPRLSSYSPVHAQFSFSGNALVRLSVGGFDNHEDAAKLCGQIRAKGGQCFVRAIAGDAPVQWVRVESGQRAG
jgi:Flp pilus assembly protein TadD